MKQTMIITAVATLAVSGAYAVNTQACTACHGANFEKKAMNVSKVVKDMSKEEIVTALKGYKAGTFGGPMKGVMAGQVAKLSDEDIEAIATQIAGGGEAKKEETPKSSATEAVKDTAAQAVDAAKSMADKAVDTAKEKAVDAAMDAAGKMLK